MVYLVLFLLVFVFTEPRSKIPTLSERVASHPRPFTPSLEGLVSLQFTFLVFLLTGHCPQITAHYCFKSFSCNTYGSPRKCCKQKTYGLAKPFRCNTYKKQGGPALRRSGVYPPISILELIPFSPSPSKASAHPRAIIDFAASASAKKASQE